MLINRLRWSMEWLGQVSAETIIARLPGELVFRIGEKIGLLLWHLMPQRRQIVLKNLRIALAGKKSLHEIRDLAKRSFVRSVANLVSAVHTAHMPARILESRVTVENPEVLEEAIKDGKGCVLLPPHMGNWEILARISRLFPSGRALGALYRPLNNPYLDARLNERRRSEGTRMFSKRDSLLEITRFLKQGGIIGILADQRAGPQGVIGNFFGRLTRSSPLPYLLIRRCKVPAFSISVRTVRPGQWALRYHPVEPPADTQACMDAIECAMRESLVDVFWFQDRWKCYATRQAPIHKWLGDADARSSRHPHRALIWLIGRKNDAMLPLKWLHGDVRYELALDENQSAPAWVDKTTTIHRIGHGVNEMEVLAELQRIDQSSALPIDFVLSLGPNAVLHKACLSAALKHIATSRA